ncbi:MAG: hypothetical protein IT162_20010 [Bryobacterales bacterium]|nr:hypothetical protein [Bryobacterales bacterium]
MLGSLPLLLAPLVLLDAHNCYPENGRWADRIDRALAQGLPVAIEQDLAWHNGRSVLSHEKQPTGKEPGMREHFFERIRPLVEKELREGDRSKWPVIVLNLDFKTDEPAHHQAVWKLLGKYERWLTTAPRTATPADPAPLDRKPVLVLTGVNAAQQQTFHDAVRVGGKLRVFGAVEGGAAGTARATNYRRWSNNPWNVVEAGGQPKAGDWTPADDARLRQLVDAAHERGLMIRFYTLNGHVAETGPEKGWGRGYNFGSLEAARLRWRAAIAAGVDFVATDQYEEFARELAAAR